MFPTTNECIDQGFLFRQLNAQFLQKMGSFEPIEKNEGKCVKKCQTIIKVSHTVSTILPKLCFIHHAKPIYAKITYKNYILKIAYSKLASFNQSSLYEGLQSLNPS